MYGYSVRAGAFVVCGGVGVRSDWVFLAAFGGIWGGLGTFVVCVRGVGVRARGMGMRLGCASRVFRLRVADSGERRGVSRLRVAPFGRYAANRR